MLRWIILSIIVVILFIIILSMTIFKDRIKSTFYIDHMERDERLDRMNIDKIFSILNIEAGTYVADIGAGSGYFSRKFSSFVGPSGKVYAVDINNELLKHIDKINLDKKIKNIETVLAAENNPNIPGSVDLIFICDTLHYIEKQENYVLKMAEYLKPGGRIAVISFYQNWPPMSNKFNEKDLTGWMKKAELKKLNYFNDFIQDEYLAIYKKEQ